MYGNRIQGLEKESNLKTIQKPIRYLHFMGSQNESTRYVTFSYKQQNSFDCFELNSRSVVEVYVTFDGVRTGTLVENNNRTNHFCMDQYIGLKHNNDYMVTLAVHDTSDHLVFFAKSAKQKPFKSFKVLPPAEYTAAPGQWLYYNDQYEFVLNGEGNINEACDVMSNCFRMQVIAKINSEINDKFHHKNISMNVLQIPDNFKKILTRSPFIRIKTNSKYLSFEESKYVHPGWFSKF